MAKVRALDPLTVSLHLALHSPGLPTPISGSVFPFLLTLLPLVKQVLYVFEMIQILPTSSLEANFR